MYSMANSPRASCERGIGKAVLSGAAGGKPEARRSRPEPLHLQAAGAVDGARTASLALARVAAAAGCAAAAALGGIERQLGFQGLDHFEVSVGQVFRSSNWTAHTYDHGAGAA